MKNRIAIASLGMAVGFAGAFALLSTAQGAGAPSVLSAYRQLDLFGDAFERVRANYVREVEDAELINAAINGMVTHLDPHSSYMDPSDFEDMQVITRGEFGGLGIEVSSEDGLVKVVAPIDGTPAKRAGITTGDFISAIDGISIQGMALNDAVERMRGAPDTQISLTILRQGEKTPLQVTITRAIIQIQNVRFEPMDDVGYIRISQFSERVVEGVEDAIESLEDEIGPRLKGYVLDLRANPGGLLDQAIGVTDVFLETGEVVSTRGRRPQDTQRYNARAGDVADGRPIVILINEGSASASEIVAGALQDHRRATVIGITSFGKGSVQTIIPLGGRAGGALRLTTARYYTPSGRSIQATGIAPDIAVSNLSAPDQAQRDQFMIRREASLAGHLDAEGAERDLSMPVIRPEPGTSVDDFQLSYALDRLRGVVMAPVAQASSNQVVPN